MIYSTTFENYTGTDISILVKAGALTLKLRLTWDTINQEDSDQMDILLKAWRDSNRLRRIGSMEVEQNEDIFTYRDSLDAIYNGWQDWIPHYDEFQSDVFPPTDPRWEMALADARLYLELLQGTAYSINIPDYPQFYEQWMGLVDILENSQETSDVVNTYQAINQDVIQYIYALNVALAPIEEEREQIDEMKYWHVTIDSPGVETRTCMLHLGAWVFPQEPTYSVQFNAPIERVGLSDLGYVTLRIDNKTEEQIV
jgi:hypothetical protein